jgi:hypothetical protein
MFRKCIVIVSWSWLLVAGMLFAADRSARWQVTFRGQQAEILLKPGETIRLRDKKTGESLFLRALSPTADSDKARIEISASEGKAPPRVVESVELAVGERAKARRVGSSVEFHLLQISSTTPSVSEAKAQRFQLTLMFPGNRKVMAMVEANPEEMVRIRDRKSGLMLAFRPALAKGGGLEVFSLNKDGRGESFRFVTRLPLGSDFTLRGDRLGLAGTAGAALRIQGRMETADPGMWDDLAHVESSSGPVQLKARWNDGDWIQGIALSGDMFRIGVPGVEGEIGFAPTSACSAGDTLSLSVFEIRRVPGVGETLKHIDTVEARSDQPIRIQGYSGQLEVQLGSPAINQAKAKCWMTCGSDSGHGCAVSCGDVDCCAYPCCFPFN